MIQVRGVITPGVMARGPLAINSRNPAGGKFTSKTFGANVRELRKALGYTQESFAQHALLDRAFYGLIERGKQNVSLRTVCALSASLGVGPAELFAGIDSQQCAEWLAGEGG